MGMYLFMLCVSQNRAAKAIGVTGFLLQTKQINSWAQ
jgi:hypothetical protein